MAIMEFSRGDGANHSLSIRAENWTPGGRLFFAAKPAIDDDNLDGSALIEHDWDDNAVSDVTINGVAYKKYSCYFPALATNQIPSNSAESVDLLGEFQWVPSNGGDPVTIPARSPKIDVIVWFDVKRRTS